MIVTRRALPRRTILAASCDPGAASSRWKVSGPLTALNRTRRIRSGGSGVVYLPNAWSSSNGTPGTEGTGFGFSPDSQAARAFPESIDGHQRADAESRRRNSKSGAVHGRCATRFLTGTIPKPFGQEGNDFHARSRSIS